MPAIEAHDLEFSYGEHPALQGVSFRVEEGRLFGLLGPNGGGKTTLFRILCTLLPPAAGTVEVLGFDVVRQAREVRQRLGVVFQSNCLDPELTLRENLLYQGRLHGIPGKELNQRMRESLELFGLSGRAGDQLRTLSGGLRRRVELARGLLHRPEVLLLDEPTAGLDPGVRHDFWEYLKRLITELSMTIVLTTHLLEEAERCSELAILDRGKLVVQGTPAELESRIGGEVVTVRTNHPEDLARLIRKRFQLEPLIVNGHLRLEDPRGHSLVAKLLDQFPEEIQSVTVSKPTLEDVFVRYTGHTLGRAVS